MSWGWTLVLWLALLALALCWGAAGYTLARTELAQKHAPRHPQLPVLAQYSDFSIRVALVALVLVAVLLAW